MKKGISITQMFLVIVVVLVIIYDSWIIYAYGKGASVSQVLIDYLYNYPIGGIAIGIVIGHIGWRMPNKPCPECGYKKGE